ncbi:MAG TPA: serine hydrolase domain-containing protein [Puia sp.]|nr:serine hydrolase domain-containing protein [Puia sp.]
MKFFLVVFSLSVFVSAASYSQSIDTKKLDSLFDMLQNRGLATGSVAISVDGKILYRRAIGFAMLDSNKKVAPDVNTKYRIGSISKMFTAIMIFQLIEEKKLNLNTKLATYFPELPNANKITIEEMLYHRSGLHDYTHDTNFPDWMDKPKTHEEMLKIITDKGPDFEPNAKADYCNTNYLLLSYIIEKITGTTYAQTLNKRIISKIGLKNTYYGKPIDIRSNEATSYKYSDSTWRKEKETDVSIHCGAGSIVSTPADLTVFIQALFAGKLITHSSLDSMTTMVDDYGMGIFPYDFDHVKGYGHGGRVEEFYSWIWYYPNKKLAISYITNGILYPRTDIMDGIRKICFNDNYSIPFSKPIVADLQKYVGTYSSSNLPFKVICKEDNNKLVFEAAGRTMQAEPMSTNYFMNLKTGSFFEFDLEKRELQIKETANVYYLQKEK